MVYGATEKDCKYNEVYLCKVNDGLECNCEEKIEAESFEVIVSKVEALVEKGYTPETVYLGVLQNAENWKSSKDTKRVSELSYNVLSRVWSYDIGREMIEPENFLESVKVYLFGYDKANYGVMAGIVESNKPEVEELVLLIEKCNWCGGTIDAEEEEFINVITNKLETMQEYREFEVEEISKKGLFKKKE